MLRLKLMGADIITSIRRRAAVPNSLILYLLLSLRIYLDTHIGCLTDYSCTYLVIVLLLGYLHINRYRVVTRSLRDQVKECFLKLDLEFLFFFSFCSDLLHCIRRVTL